MAMKLDQVVPFGRSLDEYQAMFSLSSDDLDKKIIGVADGPASFNTEMLAQGRHVVSVDPLYAFRAVDIEQRFYAVVDEIMRQVKETPNDWVWRFHRSPEQLHERRIQVLTRFLVDYERGKTEGRYIIGKLPRLDFSDKRFQLALCSHFLFLYSDHFSYEFHRAAVFEMLRIAGEVRVFPLLTLALKPSPYLMPLIEDLARDGYHHEILSVSYELQRGGNQMLCIKPAGLL
ncbi:MAG TPA: SAM-dependent methyltransferase [Nitrospira sp.]|nr:SAM-dependent methyltransferase [Nitrospira sp.]